MSKPKKEKEMQLDQKPSEKPADLDQDILSEDDMDQASKDHPLPEVDDTPKRQASLNNRIRLKERAEKHKEAFDDLPDLPGAEDEHSFKEARAFRSHNGNIITRRPTRTKPLETSAQGEVEGNVAPLSILKKREKGLGTDLNSQVGQVRRMYGGR